MPKFTSETGKLARSQSGSAKRQSIRLQKWLAKKGIEKEYVDLIIRGMQSPVVAGTAMYLLVMALEQITNKLQPLQSSQNTQPQLPSWIGSIFQKYLNITSLGIAPIIGSVVGGRVGTDLAGLKAVILIYIASGGNLAGILSSATNIFGGKGISQA